MKKILIIILLLFSLAHCSVKKTISSKQTIESSNNAPSDTVIVERCEDYFSGEDLRVCKCYERMIYKPIEQELELRVLSFRAKHHAELYWEPAWVIGTTNNNKDTVGILDIDFNGDLPLGTLIQIIKKYSSSCETTHGAPQFYRNDTIKNNLYCAVRNVYYGLIIKR